MGHLDGRLNPDKNPPDAPVSGAKDGPTGQKTETAPKKSDGAEQRIEKASDVVHEGSGSATHVDRGGERSNSSR